MARGACPRLGCMRIPHRLITYTVYLYWSLLFFPPSFLTARLSLLEHKFEQNKFLKVHLLTKV